MTTNALTEFQWEPQPEAAALVRGLTGAFLDACPGAKRLSERMLGETATRFVDWIDHVGLPRSEESIARAVSVGYERSDLPAGGPHGGEVYSHNGGIFPALVFHDRAVTRFGIKVMRVNDFLEAQGVSPKRSGGSRVGVIEGSPLGRLRVAVAFEGDDAELLAVERHGYAGFELGADEPGRASAWIRHLEAFCTRERDLPTDAEGFDLVDALVDEAVGDLGVDLACDVFFEGERRYWELRNTAARVQHARQRRLGLGWANHDHHTYRVSRSNFHRVVAVGEKLGLRCRERFYAGEEAGWGAQVMEQPVTKIISFNDVDMSADELLGDFAHEPMSERDSLGTVGLWCALHGDSMLKAGMHHLEAMFDHKALVEQLAGESGIKTMDPFTTFPYLRQAFTEGERWSVDPGRIDRLLEGGLISAEQAQTFREKGAIGSHLENLERNDGFKGFNQTGVSDIIARTDPRKLAGAM